MTQECPVRGNLYRRRKASEIHTGHTGSRVHVLYLMLSGFRRSLFFGRLPDFVRGRDTAVCIVTHYGLDGPGIESW